MEDPRVAAERVEQHEPCRDGEVSDLARPGEATDQTERHDHREGERTGIDEAHVLREIEPRPAPDVVPDLALRCPIVDLWIHRAVEIGESELHDMHGVDRAAGGRLEAHLRPVRAASSSDMMTGTAATNTALTLTAISG
jgi:hypothetical protein